MNKYKVIKAMGTFVMGDEGILPARVLQVGEVFDASAQIPVMLASGKQPRDDVRQRQGRVTAYKVMLAMRFNGQHEFAYTVRNGVRYAVPYTPPAASKAAPVLPKPDGGGDIASWRAVVDARLAVLEVAAFDKDGDGVADAEELPEVVQD